MIHLAGGRHRGTAEAGQRSYRLHGSSVRVFADNAEVLEQAHAVLEHYGLHTTLPEPSADVLELRLCMLRRADRCPEGPEARCAGGGIRLSEEGHTFDLDPVAGRGVGLVPAPPAALRKDLLLYSLLLLLYRRGFLALHASGVSREGAGYLFVADCGSGKSTHTYTLVSRGWSYLGDDVLLLRNEGTRLEALALRRDLCLDPALARHFPEVLTEGETSPFASRGKRLLRMRRLHANRLVERCLPRVLVFPEIVSGPESRLLPLEPAAALLGLVRQGIGIRLDPERVPVHFELLGRLVRQSRCYRLLAGRDAERDPEVVASLLSTVHERLF
jgi:hypothetical protein